MNHVVEEEKQQRLNYWLEMMMMWKLLALKNNKQESLSAVVQMLCVFPPNYQYWSQKYWLQIFFFLSKTGCNIDRIFLFVLYLLTLSDGCWMDDAVPGSIHTACRWRCLTVKASKRHRQCLLSFFVLFLWYWIFPPVLSQTEFLDSAFMKVMQAVCCAWSL